MGGALLVACRDSVAPTGQRLAPQDQAEIRELLTDPIVELALSDLEDQPTANRLRTGLSEEFVAMRALRLAQRYELPSTD